MSLERSITRSVGPFLPRYRSVSASRRPRLFTAARSRSQPSQKIAYCQGNVTKFIAHSRPAHSPSPQRVYLIGVGGKNAKSPLMRMSRSGSHHDLYSSHVYTTLECVADLGEQPQIEVDARATSCGDIYHKGPFYPDATYSESGVSLGESEDGSFFGAEDDNASQISYGSSSAFHEITIDSELDRLDSEDGLKSPREPASWPRFRELTSPDSTRSSPFPYADARKRELMSSPSWEFEKTQSRSNALRVLIPAPDGSLAKERLARRDSGGGSSTPLAQSTPHVSPRSFAGPKLSIKGSWNVDDPNDNGSTFNDTLSPRRMDDSSCYSSFSEDNLSDVSPSKYDKKTSRKVKLTKKASDLPAKRSDPNQLSKHNKGPGQKIGRTFVPVESLENIYIPPLESVIGEVEESVEAPTDEEGRASWWAVFNIGSATARREDAENRKSSPEIEPRAEIKIVKPAKTGIPLISPGKHGLEKLKRHSQSSPPPNNSAFSPKSSSPCPSDLSDASDDVIEEGKSIGREVEPLVKRDCRERTEDVLKKTIQGLDLSGNGAFDVVQTSSRDSDNISEASSSLEDLRGLEESPTAGNEKAGKTAIREEKSGKEMSAENQGPQPVHEDFGACIISPSYLPCISSTVPNPSSTANEMIKNNGGEKEDTVLSFTLTRIMPQDIVPSSDSKTTTNTATTVDGTYKEEQNTGLKFTLTRIMPLQTCSTADVMIKEEENMTANDKKSEPGLQFTLTRILPQEICHAEPAPPTLSTDDVSEDLANQSYDQLSAPQPIPVRDDRDNEGDSRDRVEEALNCHFVLDNSSTKGQNQKPSTVLPPTGTALPPPGKENLQVVAERGIAEVGGSDFSVNSPRLRGESHLTSPTSEICTNNNAPLSACAVSIETPVESVDGVLVSDTAFGPVQSQDIHRDDFDQLCSNFASVLTISEPDETLVTGNLAENKDEKEDGQNDKEVEGIIIKSFYPKPKLEAGFKGDDDLHHDENNSTDHLKSDQVLLTSPDVVVNEELEILRGNVGLVESKQTEPSDHGPVAKASLDLAHQEGDSSMEWKFIDSRTRNEWGKSHDEDRSRKMEVEAEEEEGLGGPVLVRVVATAQLPPTNMDDETSGENQSWCQSDQEIKYSQDSDAQIHQGFPMPIPIHYEFNNNDQNIDNHRHNCQLSGIDSQYFNIGVTSNQSNVMRSIDDDACFEIKQRRENQGSESVKYFGFDRPFEHPTSIDSNDLRGDTGISQQSEKTDAQITDGERQGTSETECLSHSLSDPAWESKVKSEATSALSQQVRRIHRKTVEETVTIERSSCKKSSRFANGRLEECDTRVEFITNRKETVIHKEDEIFTSRGPVSYVSVPTPQQQQEQQQQKQQQRDNSVSSDDLALNHNSESFNLIDLKHYSTCKEEPADPESPPLPLSPPPSQPLIIADTSQLANASFSSLPPPVLPSSSENLPTSEMKWRDVLTNFPARSSFDTTCDPFIDGQDKSTVIAAQQESDTITKPAAPVMHHSALDHLQAQLSHISDGTAFHIPSTPPFPYVYRDFGEATTHVSKVNGEVTGQAHNTMGHTHNTNDLGSAHNIPLRNNNESGIPDLEIYDNDYDYVIADQARATHPPPRQHHLLKSGQMKASSLWTLKEETDSLLDGLSPVSSPKRHFSNTAIDEKNENLSTAHSHDNDERNDTGLDNRNWNSLYPSVSSALGQKKGGFESSDESDGNYSSISTTDSSSFRSSGYGREPTPLSDSDGSVPGDWGVDKTDYLAQTGRSQGQAVDGIRSFNDFVSGLESEPLSSDWANKSNAPASDDESTQPSSNNFWDSPAAAPTTFKSSLAFCVSAAPPQLTSHHCQETSSTVYKETSLQLQQPTPHRTAIIIPDFASTINSTSIRFPVSPRTVGIPPFPVEEDSLNVSSSASSIHHPVNDGHSDASSRLYALDLDLSRISSCASPTPSDFSDGSFFTSKGTAEVKKRHSVSFEDDYDMVPVYPSVPTSTPKPLKSVLKKPSKSEENKPQAKNSHDEAWVKRFDRILEDFNNKTSTLGSTSEVMVLENTRPVHAGVASTQGPNFNDLYKAFTNDDSEKKQNHICPVVEDDNMSTFRFKRFLKKSHTKRSKGRRLVRFLSRLGCVSESVQSPDLSAARKRGKLEDGQAYGTDFMPPPPERGHQLLLSDSSSFQRHAVLSHNKDSPTSSNHSLDSCPSRTDSAYSSVSESLSGMLSNSPQNSSRLPTNSFSSVSSANGTIHQSDSSDLFYLDSMHSSTSPDHSSLRPVSETTVDPFSPLPVNRKYSQDMLTALSDVFDQLDVCEGEIDTALLDRLRCGHQGIHFSKDA